MLSSSVVSLQFSSPAKSVSLLVFTLWYSHRRGRSGSLFDCICHNMTIFTTALSLRPNGESLQTLEKVSGTLKKARSKTDGEVPALKRVGKVMPWNKCPISVNSSRWSENDPMCENELLFFYRNPFRYPLYASGDRNQCSRSLILSTRH